MFEFNMKQPVEAFYDWIVFGDHLAGLWFSSVLASAGLKIAVIPTLTDSNLSGNHLREPNWFPDFLELFRGSIVLTTFRY